MSWKIAVLLWLMEIHPPLQPPKLLDQVRDKIKVKHYSIRTETQYIHWIKRFIPVHDKRHPRDWGTTEVAAFLTHLATAGCVSASTQIGYDITCFAH
jgi:hypothetical protein